MSRITTLLFGTASYLLGGAVFAYGVCFIGGFLTPTTLDGPQRQPTGHALAVDLGLLSLFAVQHSGMARPAFKRWWTRYVPAPVARSTYVLASSLVLLLLFWQWRTLPW